MVYVVNGGVGTRHCPLAQLLTYLHKLPNSHSTSPHHFPAIWFEGSPPAGYNLVQTDFLPQEVWAKMFHIRLSNVLNAAACAGMCDILDDCDLWTHKDDICGLGNTGSDSEFAVNTTDLGGIHIKPGELPE